MKRFLLLWGKDWKSWDKIQRNDLSIFSEDTNLVNGEFG